MTGPSALRRAVIAASVVSACYPDSSEQAPCATIGCQSLYASIDAGKLVYPDQLPLTLHACIDGRCVDLEVKNGRCATPDTSPIYVTCGSSEAAETWFLAGPSSANLEIGAHALTFDLADHTDTLVRSWKVDVDVVQDPPNACGSCRRVIPRAHDSGLKTPARGPWRVKLSKARSGDSICR